MLKRLIYASQPGQALGPTQVQDILDIARQNNSRRDITGFLALDSQYFLQAREGEASVLSDLYGQLVRDTRHHKLLLLSDDSVEQRRFTGWQMGFAAANSARRSLYLRNDASSRFEPYQLSGSDALALLSDLSELPEEPVAVPAH